VVLLSACADIGYSGSFALGGSSAIVGTIGGSYAALSTILMYIFYKEPMSRQQKLGAAISIAGIILTAFFSAA
jgi:drug/metabolite transporter (DMT)-like permease